VIVDTRDQVVFAPLPNAVPAPVTMTGSVFNDVMTRTLIVRRPENASGYQKLLWRESRRALEQAVDGGWQSDHPTVWAATKGDSHIASGAPGPDFLSLAFHFPPGRQAYAALVSKPGLYALVTADRNLRRFLGVKFLHRP
jgi:hypothetical protein